MAKTPRTLKQHLIAHVEWLPIALGQWLLPRLSRPTLLWLAKVFAWLGMHLDRKSRRFAIENIRFVFPNLSEKRRHAILVGCYRNITRVLFDMFWFGSSEGAERVLRWAPIAPSWKAFLDLPGPKVIVSAHHGNWEMAGQVVAVNGFSLLSVGKPLGTDETTRKLNAFRSRLGQEIVSSAGAVAPLLRALRKGKNIALLADQHLWDKKGGVWVDFLGHPAQLAPTPAFFAERAPDSVIAVAYLRACPDGSYRGFPPIVLQRLENERIEALTQRIADASSVFIRRFPTQWLFAYRLWRDMPKGQDAACWPTYSIPVPD